MKGRTENRKAKAQEVEIKLAVTGASAARKRIRAARFKTATPRVFEENIVLDTPDLALLKAGLLLRLRRAGKAVKCTFKGPQIAGRHKRRVEHEFRADDFDKALALFSGLGYSAVFRYEKYRTEFARAGEAGLVTLDETPIGVFIEIEGPARWIDRAAKELGYSRADYILASYGRLYAEWREAHASAPKDMVFRARTG